MNRLVATGVGIGLAAGALALALAVPALLDRTAGGADGQAAHAAHGTDDAEWGNGLAGIEVLDQAALADGSRDAAAAEPGSAEEDVTFATEAGLEVSGPASLRGSDEVAALERALAGLEAGGHDAGLVLLDLRTGRRAEYGADVQRYPASCAKALFCCALVQRDGWSEEAAPTIESCLVDSSNEAYEALVSPAGGCSLLSAWLGEAGAPEAAENARAHWYPMMSARELAAAWQSVCGFVASDRPGATELARTLARTGFSPIASALRDECPVLSKPGWYPADETGLASSNDAGIVVAESGPYVLVVMSDRGADLDSLVPVVTAADALHEALVA